MGAVSGQTSAPHMLLLLQRSTQQQQALNEYVSDLQNPSSPSYHQWLTPTQFADSYGVNAEDVASVTSWLQSEGFSIDKVSAARTVIEFSGTAAQLQQAFQTQIHRLNLGATTEITAVTNVQVPRALAPVIRGLVNLDGVHPHSLFQPGPRGHFDSSTHSIKPDFTVYSQSTPLLFVDPSDAALIYDTPNAALNPNFHGTTLDGTGINVGVVGDSDVDLSLVANYRQLFLGETAANQNLPTVVVDGDDPGENGDEVESWLDLEILGGIAPNAKLYYYTSEGDDLTLGLQNAILRAVNDNTVSILSISYGSCEALQGTQGNAFFSEVYEQAAAQGITITVSTGDSGSAGCDSSASMEAVSGLAVNGLASTPYNIAVGGTDFDILGSEFDTYVYADPNLQNSGSAPYYLTAKSYIPENPWNNSTSINTTLANNTPLLLDGSTNIVGGGGGVSSLYTKPAFQTSLTPQDGYRDLPDVSFLAANGLYGATWVFCEHTIAGNDCTNTNGQFTSSTTVDGVGGTSAASPAFAGMLALLEQSTGSRLGQANNVLYQLAASKYSTVMHDVTTGNNSVVCSYGSTDCDGSGFLTGWDAATGYDQASGLGSVDVAQMVSNWSSVALTSTNTTLTINGSTASVSATHGKSLTFQVGVDPAAATGNVALIGNESTMSGLLTVPLTSGNGTVSYNGLPGGQYTVYARYGGDGSYAASSSSAISVNIAKETSTTAFSLNAYDPTTGASLASNTVVPYGAYLFLDATVYGAAEGQAGTQGFPTGTISFADSSAPLGTTNINSVGNASLNSQNLGTYPLNAGSHKLTASFPGDVSYDASTSTPFNLTITKANSQMSIVPAVASGSTATYNAFQVQILEAGVGLTASGTVTLEANGKTIGTATLQEFSSSASNVVMAVASFNISGSDMPSGVETLTAVYPGDVNYVGNTVSIPYTVSQANFSLSTSPINIAAGATTGNTATISVTPLDYFTGAVNLTCAVTSAPANATDPVTCSVPASVKITGLNSVPATLTATSQSYTTSGAYTITVTGTDAATGKLTAKTTSIVTVSGTLTQPDFALSTSPISLTAGATTGNTATVTLTPLAGFTGAVNLTCGVTSAPSDATDPVTCTVPSSATIAGAAAATATLTANSATDTTSGSYTITITGTDAATGKITASTTSTVTVTGTVAAPPGIAVSSSGAVSVAPGATTGNTATLTVTPSGGFTGTVGLACQVTTSPSGANDPVTCSLSSSSVSITGTGTATATLTIDSTASTTSALKRDLGTGGAFLAIALIFVPASRRRRLTSLACLALLAATFGALTGCGSDGKVTTPPTTTPGTTAGAYVVTVTASNASITSATTTVNVTVN